jgi:O-antigen/teichoic acid export membrane protein
MNLNKNIIANFIGQGWTALMGIVFLPIYIELLGVEAYGLIGFYALIQASLTILDIGITPTLTREMARFTAGALSPESINDLLRSFEIISYCLAISIGLVVCFSSDWIATNWLKLDQMQVETCSRAIMVMGGVVTLRLIEGIYRGSLLGLQKQVLYNVLNSLFATARALGAIAVLVWLTPTIDIYFAWQAIISILSLVTLALVTHKYLPTLPRISRFSRQEVGRVWKFAGGMMAITLFVLLLTQLDKVLLSRLLPLQEFGYYTLAATVAGILFLLITPISQAIYPRLIELHTLGDEKGLISTYHESAQLITVLTTPVALLLFFFSGGIIFMWSGDAELAEKTAPILTALALGSFLNGLMHIPYHLQLAHGWTSLTFKVNVIAVILLLPAIFWIVPRYGSIGAAWVWVTLNAGYVIFSINFMHRRILPEEKRRWYIDDILLPVGGTVIYSVMVSQLQPAGYHDRFDWFFFIIIIGITSFFLAALLAKHIRIMLRIYLVQCIQNFWISNKFK